MRENFGIGVFFLGPVKLRFESKFDRQELENRLEKSKNYNCKAGKFGSCLSLFQKVFPFNHFVTIKGRLLKDNVVELTITPIFVRVMQLTIVSLVALVLSAVRLYENQSWKVIAILGLHLTVLGTVWFVLRILYVADARTKVSRARRFLRLMEEV